MLHIRKYTSGIVCNAHQCDEALVEEVSLQCVEKLANKSLQNKLEFAAIAITTVHSYDDDDDADGDHGRNGNSSNWNVWVSSLFVGIISRRCRAANE